MYNEYSALEIVSTNAIKKKEINIICGYSRHPSIWYLYQKHQKDEYINHTLIISESNPLKRLHWFHQRTQVHLSTLFFIQSTLSFPRGSRKQILDKTELIN